jgi:nicotinate-nucleotide--dimethylbenzimidazole phosphoribosyltransferase
VGTVSEGDANRFLRPPTPAGFDSSRAAERAHDPRGWRYPEDQRATVHRVIAERRDIRRFRADPVPDDVLGRVLAAAHRAPSVGLMQPWRFIVVRSIETRVAVRRMAQRERLRQADRFDARARQFLDQKIEGVVEAPLGICVCCDHGAPDEEVLGRGTIPETDVYSTACAIENLWLAARAEGLGVGWVSFYRPPELRALLGIPSRVDPIAYLCVGWPDERPSRPGLESSGWAARMPLDEVVTQERWEGAVQERGESAPNARPTAQATGPPLTPAQAKGPRLGRPDRSAAVAARDRLDRLVKPSGSLGALEPLIERWAAVTKAPPPARLRAGVLVCAADHGHVGHGTSLFDGPVSAQVAAAAARGETAVGVLADRGGHVLLVADVGLRGDTPPGVEARKVAQGSADMTVREALTAEEVDRAVATGRRLAGEVIDQGVDCLALGEIGIGNTTTTAALACALTGASPALTVGRGTGMDTAGLERKRAVVEKALALHAQARKPEDALRAVGGIELAALLGAVLEASSRRVPVILDGYPTAVVALAAVRMEPLVYEALFASHQAAEPGHRLVLTELGLEPLLDLRLRLGEASGALLTIPLSSLPARFTEAWGRSPRPVLANRPGRSGGTREPEGMPVPVGSRHGLKGRVPGARGTERRRQDLITRRPCR